MPELPEVEVVRQGLSPLLIHRLVTGCSFSNKKLRQPVPKSALKGLIKGSRVCAVGRRAKYLLIYMENGAVVIIHLGMTGRLGLFPGASPRLKHDHVRFRLDNDMELRFNDTRRFGSVQVVSPGMEVGDFFANIGPEPFAEDFSDEYLLAKAKNRHQPVKNFLMDSRVVAGIGNIYASEILFCSRIRPTRPACTLSRQQWRNMIACCRDVLRKAINAGGTTIADYVNASGKPGYFQLELMVYGRNNEKCRKCGGDIAKVVQAGRATYFCKKCQK